MTAGLEPLQTEIIRALAAQRRLGGAIAGKSLVGLEAVCKGWHSAAHMRRELGDLLILGVVIATKLDGHFTRYELAADVSIDGEEPPLPRLKVEFVNAGPGLPQYARVIEIKSPLSVEGAMP